MTNTTALGNKINESGITLTHISKSMKISRESLYNKMQGKSEFKASEIQSLSVILGLTEKERSRIFFA